MMPADLQQFPELRQLCGAYLNADFASEYGSVAAALRAYRQETGATHRRALLSELDRLLASASSDDSIGDELVELGCEVYFATGSDARAVVDEIKHVLAD